MRQLDLPGNDVIALATLALLVGLASLIPWLLSVREAEQQKPLDRVVFDFLNNKNARAGENPPRWRVNTEYSPASGRLQVWLKHRYNAPADDFLLMARFNPEGNRRQVQGAWLKSLSGGLYQTDGMRLTKGVWIMRLTGRRRSQVEFLLEQPLLVE